LSQAAMNAPGAFFSPMPGVDQYGKLGGFSGSHQTPFSTAVRGARRLPTKATTQPNP
jgi:hypothetical protein